MMKRIFFTFLVSLPFFTFSKRHDFNIVLNVIDKAQHALSPAHIFKKLAHVLLSGAAENLNNTATKQRARFQQRYQEEQRAIEENKRFLQKMEQQRQQAAVSTGTFTTEQSSPQSPQPNPLPNHHKIAESFHHKSNGSDDHYRKRKESLDHDIHNNWHTYSNTYKISHESQQLLQTYQLSWHEGQFCGTHLQHQLHQEALACLDQAALLNNKVAQPTIQSLVYTTATMSCAADEYNKLHAIERSCLLLDVCHSLLDYGYAVIDCCCATGQGVVAGIEHTLETAEWIEQQILNFALRPQETREKFVKSLNKAATNLALFIKEFCPLTVDLADAYCSGIDHYLDYNLRIAHNWQNAITCLWQQIKNTPPRELVKGTAQLITENIFLEKSFTALGSFGAAAKAELEAINYTKFYQLPSGAVPGFLIIDHTHTAQKIISFAEQSSIAAENVAKALEHIELPAVCNSLSRLCEAVAVFEHTEGFKEVFERMIVRGLEQETLAARRYLYQIEKELIRVEQKKILPTSVKFSLPENFPTNPPKNITIQGARYQILGNGQRCRIIVPENTFYAETKWVDSQYEKIRQMKDDVQIISQNIGWPYKRVERIKNHLFYDEHILSNKIEPFDADVEIASAWDRLIRGDFVQNDIDLLMHEYWESKFEKLFKTDYITAHDQGKAADRVWNPYK